MRPTADERRARVLLPASRERFGGSIRREHSGMERRCQACRAVGARVADEAALWEMRRRSAALYSSCIM